MQNRFALASCLFAMSIGCGSKANTDVAKTVSAAPEPAPVASASSTPSAVVSAATSVAVPPEPVPTAMHLFAKSDVGELHALPADGGALIVAIEPFSEDPPAVLVQHGDVTPVHGLFSGIGRQDEEYRQGNHVRGLAGHYPDRFYALVSQGGGRSGSEDYYYRSVGGHWQQDIGPDSGDIAFVAGDPVAIKAVSVEPVRLGIFGSQARFPSEPEGEEGSPCSGRKGWGSPIVLAGTPAGDLFMFAYKCGEDMVPVVDLWTKGKAESVTTPIPFVRPIGPHPTLVARSAKEAYVAGADDEEKGYLARFDGSKWTREKRPLPAIYDMAGADDGTIWLLAGDKVLRRAVDGTFTELPIPEEVMKTLPPEHIVATSGTEVWAFAGNLVLGTYAPKTVVNIDAGSLGPKAANAACKTVFVQLYAITKLTPPNFDFPKTRDAMKGHPEFSGARFVVTKDDRFGAIVKTLDEGKSLAQVAREGVKGSHPQLLCMKPDEVREVKFGAAAAGDKK